MPYLNGNPDTSFEVDPEHLQTREKWKEFFNERSIGWVVRSPDYPDAIAAPLCEMEKNGDLVLFAQSEVQNFEGNRIDESTCRQRSSY